VDGAQLGGEGRHRLVVGRAGGHLLVQPLLGPRQLLVLTLETLHLLERGAQL
jgi:hypothetical protein